MCEAGGSGSFGSKCLNSCILAAMSFGHLTTSSPCMCTLQTKAHMSYACNSIQYYVISM